MSEEQVLIQVVKKLMRLVWTLIACTMGSTALFVGDALELFTLKEEKPSLLAAASTSSPTPAARAVWQAPDTTLIPEDAQGELIRYGHQLIAHTSVYLGPKGKVTPISNGMNCQNCHLKAGTVPFGNNYGKVASTYPKFRSRSGTIEGFEKRINDCIERSLNGKPLQTDSREMQAMVAYLKWVGKEVKTADQLSGFGLVELAPLHRAADPEKGKVVYAQYCARCHGQQGEGQMADNGVEWTYPPLYGDNSYNVGAGLYRLSKFASFVKANMPYGVSYEAPFLTDEEAWDVAAYVNSMPRPSKEFSADWPDLSQKPFDHPFGPYADTFPQQQHEYGPFPPSHAAYQQK